MIFPDKPRITYAPIKDLALHGKQRYIALNVVEWFRKQVEGGGNYIKQQGESLETILRRVIREEMKAEQQQVAA